MKKTLFALIALAVAAVACNKAEVIDMDKETIAFGNIFVDNATKADPSYSANDITSFQVYGTVNGGHGDVLIYPGTVIKKNQAEYGTAWTCPVAQYWVPGANYTFVGIVDGNKTGVSTVNLTDGMPTTIDYTADGVTDLLCQTITKQAKTDGTSNGIVTFNFAHLLAKAKFTVNNNSTAATNYLHKVRDIKITNAYNTGTYDVANESWNDLVSNAGQAFDGIVAEAASTECENEKLLIPGLSSVTVEFVVDLYYVETVGGVKKETLVGTTAYTGTNAKTATVAIEAAQAYDFNITVSVGELIQFSVKEQPKWTDAGNVTVQ